MIHFSIIIATDNRANVLKHALASVNRQTYKNLDVIVAHTGKSDGTYESVQGSKSSEIPILYFRAKLSGSANQRNEALVVAKGDWIFFLDDDIVLESNFFEEIVIALRARPDAGGISGRISNQFSKPLNILLRTLLWFSGGGFSSNVNGKIRGPVINFLPYEYGSDVDEIEWMPTCVCGYKREVLEEAGGFPKFFTDYSLGEDIYLSTRVSKKHPLILVRRAVLFHNYLGGTNKMKAYKIGKMQIYNRVYILKEVYGAASYLNILRLLFWNVSNSILNFILGHRSITVLFNSWCGYVVGSYKSLSIR